VHEVNSVRGYSALAVILAFIAAGAWWRSSGEPTTGGLAIVAVAFTLTADAVELTRRRSGP
jgi:hypothetical protein